MKEKVKQYIKEAEKIIKEQKEALEKLKQSYSADSRYGKDIK